MNKTSTPTAGPRVLRAPSPQPAPTKALAPRPAQPSARVEAASQAVLQADAPGWLTPSSLAEAREMAREMAPSGLLPQELRGKPGDVLILMMCGAELGLKPMQALRSIYVVKGKPVLSADLLVALVKRSPKCRYFQLIQTLPTVATYETHREGEPEPVRLSWTVEKAKEAGLTGGATWRGHADTMLRHRCAAALAREVYPDLALGLYVEEEAAEIRAGEAPRPAPARAAQPPHRSAPPPPQEPPTAPEEEAELVDSEGVEEAQANPDESSEEREPGADEEEVPPMPSTVEGWVERVSGALSAAELDELAAAWKGAMPREAHRAIGVASKARRDALATPPVRAPQLDHYDPAAEVTRGLEGGAA